MASGGAQLSDLRPLDPTGALYADRIGCYRGEWEHLNVRNAQPGMVYRLAKRRGARIQTLRRLGYKVVGPEDPERLGDATDPNLRNAGIDSLQATEDVVLMKCPEHLFRKRAQERLARNAAAINGATDEFLAKGDAGERRYSTPDRPIRFKNPKHQTWTEER